MLRAADLSEPIRSLLSETALRVRADAPLYLFIALYTVLGLAFLALSGAQDRASYAIYVTRWLTLFGVFLPAGAIILHVALLAHRFDRRRGLAARRIFSPQNAGTFLAGIALLMAMVLFQGTFTSVKNAIAVWHRGFPFDRLQADIDAAIHFGVDPWRLLYAIGESDLVRMAVEWNYNVLWFVISFGALFFVVTSPRTAAIRTRYVLSFMLVWIVVGNVFAGLFMSAGPAFYTHVTGDAARFGEQMAFLARGAGAPNSAAAYQSYLWSLHEAGLTGFGSGISAFPSVHVGLISLNAMFVCEYSRRLGMLAFAYVALVLASSVYLAWHYAIDGYAAIGLTLLIYLALKRWLPHAVPLRRAPAGRPDAVAGAALTAS